MLFDLWDIFQHRQIKTVDEKAELARVDSRQTGERLQFEAQRLEAKIDGLALICEALWELVRENTNLTNEDIHRKIEEIDLRDGRRDGRISGSVTECRKCHRQAHTRQVTCMYCGEPLSPSNS